MSSNNTQHYLYPQNELSSYSRNIKIYIIYMLLKIGKVIYVVSKLNLQKRLQIYLRSSLCKSKRAGIRFKQR